MAAPHYTTPGVYVAENLSSFSIYPTPTSLPAFIGYTEKAESYDKKSLELQPTLVNSLPEFEALFGKAPKCTFPIYERSDKDGMAPVYTPTFSLNNKTYGIGAAKSGYFLLYNSIRLYFQNGGGSTYIVSVGTYESAGQASKDKLLAGLQGLEKSPVTPTLLVIPDALVLEQSADCYAVQNAMIRQAGTLEDRFAILDIYQGYKGLDTTVISDFRAGIGTEHLDFAACYYPWLNTSITTEQEVELSNAYQPAERETGPTAAVDIKALVGNDLQAQQTLRQALCQKINQLPPGPALAGIYCTVDNDGGVWTAPANRNIQGALGPIVAIDDQQQQDLHTDASGKSINAIRAFYGRGPAIVWGARTLNGNDQDLRYINIKRTIIYIQQSIRSGLQRYAFEQNIQTTWDTCTAEITSFLDGLWRSGGLVGTSPDRAFTVQIGLNRTMTQQDILYGKMRVSVHCAFTHPAEFMVLNFEQQMAAH